MSKMSNFFRNIWIRNAAVVIALVAVAGLGTALFDATNAHAQLEAWKLVPAPERYTELSFDRPETLPVTVSTRPATFRFTIRNLEGTDTTYPYMVEVKTADGSVQRLAAGSV